MHATRASSFQDPFHDAREDIAPRHFDPNQQHDETQNPDHHDLHHARISTNQHFLRLLAAAEPGTLHRRYWNPNEIRHPNDRVENLTERLFLPQFKETYP